MGARSYALGAGEEQQISFDHSTNKLYIITTANFNPTKIGIGCNSQARLKSIQTSNWEALHLHKTFLCPEGAAYLAEWHLHKCLKDMMLRGEWFDVRAQIIEYIIFRKLARVEANQDVMKRSIYVP